MKAFEFYLFVGHYCGACHELMDDLRYASDRLTWDVSSVVAFSIYSDDFVQEANLKIVYADDLPELANSYEVHNLPTVVLVDDPSVRLDGCGDYKRLVQWLADEVFE